MTVDRRPLRQPLFSETSTDQPLSEERDALLPVERSLFREPEAAAVGLPGQSAGARAPLGSGGLTFTAGAQSSRS